MPAGAVEEVEAAPPALSYGALFRRFLRFGALAWGGPVAQIGMLRRELVDEEHWLSSSRFNRVLAVYQVLPGPEASELCVYFGMIARGRLGGLLAGLGFVLPGFALMLALSWLYFAVDLRMSAFGAFFLGVQPAVMALITRAVHQIGRHVVVDSWLWLLAIQAGAATVLGVSFWVTLPVSGALYALLHNRSYLMAGIVWAAAAAGAVAPVLLGGDPSTVSSVAASVVTPGVPSTLELFASGLKVGLLTFGGAYTAIPFLRDDAVGRGWMSDAQFLDGIALSGILPAPLIIFSTFVGYFGGGPLGALAMTFGVYLPAFSFTLLFHERLERLVDHEGPRRFLEGVSAGVVGLIAATAIELAIVTAGTAPALAPALAIFASALGLLYAVKARAAVAFVVLGAGFAGLLIY